MNEKQIRSALKDALEAEIPTASVDLWPRVRAGLVVGNTRQGKMMNTHLRRSILATLATITLLVIALATPQGRALAQRMFQFFTVTDQNSFPIPTEQVMPAPATPTPLPAALLAVEPIAVEEATPTAAADEDCSTHAGQATYACQVSAAEAQAGFDAKEFLYDPKGMTFSSATYNASTGEINMKFVVTTGGGYLYLRQGVAGWPETTDNWSKAPAKAVEQVSVNGKYAEIASGTFVVYPNATKAVWEPGGQITLAWRDGEYWFALEKMGDPYPIEWITKEQLVKLAEGLVDERPEGAVPPLDPEYLLSVEQAETLTGFDIPAPSLLPAGYELKRVVWMDQVVRLLYGPKESSQSELFIFLGPIDNNTVEACVECPPGVVETIQVGSWQGWYWRGILHSDSSAVAGQPTPTPIWQGDAPHWTLAWNTDTFWFSMFFSPTYNSGKEINQEQLIQIAESMQ